MTAPAAREIEFLEAEHVVVLHHRQLARYGGADGLRDRGLLESAVAQAQMTFGGEFVHQGLFATAGTDLFHVVNNHAFVDGNKRTRLLAAIPFLRLNGIPIQHDSEALHALTIGVAEHRIDKQLSPWNWSRSPMQPGTADQAASTRLVDTRAIPLSGL